MPTKIRATVVHRGLSGGRIGAGLITEGRVFFCPSCSTWRRRTLSTAATTTTTTTTRYHTRNAGFRGSHSNRYPSLGYIDYSHNITTTTTTPTPTPATFRRFLSSSTSLSNSADFVHVNNNNNNNNNNTRNVPVRFRELHAALKELEKVVGDHISLSRLQLAQRGLESDEPVIRVAVLGVNDVRATRNLVRLLLADPLTERQDWEGWIDSYEFEGSNGFVIRYGEEPDLNTDNGYFHTMTVPSPLLRKGKIELLVGTLEDTVPVSEEAFFVPIIDIVTENGDHESIEYPVHKSILCGSGTDGLLTFSSLLGRGDLGSSQNLVHGVVELNIGGVKQKDNTVTFVNTDDAETALAKFRESVAFASEYERGWTAGGVQSVADWLSVKSAKTGLGSDLQTNIQSLLDTVEEKIDAEEIIRIADRQELTHTSAETRQSLDQSVTVWAERAHTELRNSLDEGFASQRWKGLSWWKLFWRVDDVGSIMSEILQTRYLPRSEKEMIWTAGRVKQTGLLDGAPNSPDLSETKSVVEEVVEDADKTEAISSKTEVNIHPWPLQIATSRLQMLRTTIPSLQALSQGLVLFSASTTALTSALSTLLYTSASTGLYEACTIATVGLIYSARRQQVKWEDARSSWEAAVREQGRTALIETENVLRALIRDGPSVQKDESVETRAKTIITRARKALEDVKEK